MQRVYAQSMCTFIVEYSFLCTIMPLLHSEKSSVVTCRVTILLTWQKLFWISSGNVVCRSKRDLTWICVNQLFQKANVHMFNFPSVLEQNILDVATKHLLNVEFLLPEVCTVSRSCDRHYFNIFRYATSSRLSCSEAQSYSSSCSHSPEQSQVTNCSSLSLPSDPLMTLSAVVIAAPCSP